MHGFFRLQRASRKHVKTNRKTWFLNMKCPIMTSPLFCAHANGRRGTHGKPRGTKGGQKRPQGGSKGGPGAAKGAQGRPEGGPRGAKGGPRDPFPSLIFHFWSQNGHRGGMVGKPPREVYIKKGSHVEDLTRLGPLARRIFENKTFCLTVWGAKPGWSQTWVV